MSRRVRLDFSKTYTGRYGILRSTTLHCLQSVVDQWVASQSTKELDEEELRRQATMFANDIDNAFELAEKNTHRTKNPLYWFLQDAFASRGMKGLARQVQFSFQSFISEKRFSKDVEENQQRLLDFRYPHEWFPATRTVQRTIHVHVGPTNSGKTHNALKALENSKRGVYAGPLRLLAAEVYQRLNAKGHACALITGEEVRLPEKTDQYFSSCTVEMIPLNTRFDVAVIDEIQMLADPERGNGWTTALLGVQATEVHVCGEERAVAAVEALCASVGDKCIVHRYERLSPLQVMSQSMNGDFGKLQKGDAIVAFSRVSLHALKRKVERQTGRRCAIIYGSLPPEVRVQQAALFNDPDNDYDFVVASDAIGMGLNLEIRRVILDTVAKYDGNQQRLLTYPEIKQIGGRAGRYRTARTEADGAGSEAVGPEAAGDKVGYVTTMDRQDLRSVQQAFTARIQDIEAVYVDPPAGVVERFSAYFPPGTPLSYILMRIKVAATVGPRYRLNVSREILEIADIIQDLSLSIHDRLTFCYLPAVLRADGAVDVLRALARAVTENSGGDLLSIKEIPLEILDLDKESRRQMGTQEYLAKLETLHVAINQYVWLSYRYSGIFPNQALAFHVRSMVEEKLIETLEHLDFTEEEMALSRVRRRMWAQSHQKKLEELGVEGGSRRQSEQTCRWQGGLTVRACRRETRPRWRLEGFGG